MTREILFRQYHECQHGHPRFLYWKPVDGFTTSAVWGDRHADCKCPIFSIGEGFAAKGPHEQYTGLKDKNGKEAYFSDTVNAKIRDANGVVFDVIGTIGWGEFEIQLEMESDYWPVASWSLVESFEITGNIHQKL